MLFIDLNSKKVLLFLPTLPVCRRSRPVPAPPRQRKLILLRNCLFFKHICALASGAVAWLFSTSQIDNIPAIVFYFLFSHSFLLILSDGVYGAVIYKFPLFLFFNEEFE